MVFYKSELLIINVDCSNCSNTSHYRQMSFLRGKNYMPIIIFEEASVCDSLHLVSVFYQVSTDQKIMIKRLERHLNKIPCDHIINMKMSV